MGEEILEYKNMLMSCLAGSLEFYFLGACLEQIILQHHSLFQAHGFHMKRSNFRRNTIKVNLKRKIHIKGDWIVQAVKQKTCVTC